MYTPYDQYLEQTAQNMNLDNSWSGKDNYFTPGKLMAGASAGVMGLGVLGAVGTLTRIAHNRAMSNSPGYAAGNAKLKKNMLYKNITSPMTALSPFSPIGFRQVQDMDSALLFGRKSVGLSANNRLLKPFHNIMFNKNFNTAVNSNIRMTPQQMNPKFMIKAPLMLPMAVGMGIMGEQAINNHPSAVPVGAARTGLAFAGGAAGQIVGAGIGSIILPGVGTAVGAVAGGIIGSVAGESAIDTVKWMKQKGREWSKANIGGSFSDSQMAMTMRQRSLNAIYSSQFNVRSNLGTEAYRLATGY